MPGEMLLLQLTAGVALLALLLAFWQLLVTRRLRRELIRLHEQLQQQQPIVEEKKVNFSTSLDNAERQQPNLPSGVRNSPEKYRYVAALADQGLDAKGIAAALKLAPAEVEQLLQLARLKPQRPT